jgi:glycopeptide antibiotics resistance protein
MILLIYKRFDVCSWYLISSCGGTTLLIALPVLMNPGNITLDYSIVILTPCNWLAAVAISFFIRIFDKKEKFKNFTFFFKSVSIVFFVMYIFIFVYTLFIGEGPRSFRHRGINLIPFDTILPYITGEAYNRANADIIAINILANILLLVPVGFYLSVIFKKLNLFLRIIIIFIIPIAIETVQYLLYIGIADIDDVILNFTGGLIGIFISYIIEKIYKIAMGDNAKGLLAWD